MREYDCVSALSGSCMILIATHLPFSFANDRAVLRAVDGELLLRHAGVRLVRHGDLLRDERPLFVAVLIEVLIALLDDRLEVLVEVVDVARRVHPAGARR